MKLNRLRRLTQILFPDKQFDGQFQNPGSEKIFDFNDVMNSSRSISIITQDIAYYPPHDQRELFGIFIPGLGQVAAESSKRSRRYAERINTGIANLNNASFLKKNPILDSINPYLDWIDAAIHRLGLSNSPVIDNIARLILDGIEQNQVLNLSGDSHGTILLGRGLQRAKRKFIHSSTPFWNLKQRRNQALAWEEYSQQLINILAFGNGFQKWVKGPKYIMVYTEGDPLPEKLGINPEKATQKGRDDIQFIRFSRLFPEGSFEAHNMMFTIEMLRQTFLKNNLEVGDFVGLYHQLNHNTLKIATSHEISWPEDMQDYTWDPESLNSILNSQNQSSQD